LPIKAKPSKDGGAKSERLKPAKVSGQDRPTAERQNQGNLMTQSHGSTITHFIVRDHDRQTAEEQIFLQG
jgi:hypothetical protein